jgi:type VI secretion system secreted protein VgrG
MSHATQATRKIAIETPLGEDVLLLRSFSASEHISRLFEFELDLLSENHEINFDEIIGQNVTIRMDLPEGGTRYWNGFINRFVQGASTSRQFAQYRATMVPWLWFLTLKSDCRIFQQMSVPQIVRQVFEDLEFSDIEDRTSGGYRTWTYCVQYRETAFNFVSRLMEQEGIYYYFAHEQGKCTIVLCDSRSKHDTFADHEKIAFIPDSRASSTQERINAWTVVKNVSSGKFAHTDYNFLKPSASLMSVEEDQKGHAHAGYEIYDYPGEYAENADGDKYAKVRMEELAQSHEVCDGASDSRGLCAGYLFTLTRHSRRDQNREYLIVSTTCHAAAQGYETSGGQQELWTCSFQAIPSTVQFRPVRTTPKPVIDGTQTAVVCGPAGDEIYTDEHGQVKVQFHWDRLGQYDENSSCWIRVAQNWAGNRWGGLYIPRIGQEVIVTFLEGDPDQPIIVGAVYHGSNRPPYELPAEKTKSTLKSDSSPGGGGSNEIRFEDKAGDEEVYVHAQRDMNSVVKADKTLEVGGDRTTHVAGNFSEEIDGNEKRTVKGSVDETILSGETRTVNAGVTETISGGETREVTGGLTETIIGNEDRTITGSQTKSITGQKSETVTGGITVTTPAQYNLTATGGVTMTATAGMKVIAPAGFTIIAPGGNTTIDSFFDRIGGKALDLFSDYVDTVGIETKLCGMSNAATATKIELAGFVVDRTYAKNENEPLSLKQGGINLANGTAKILDFGLTMIGL